MSSNVIDFYNQYLDAFPVKNPSAVGWTDKNAQFKRFSVLFNIGVGDSDRLLDYGCGLGHLNEFIALNHLKIDYFGCDINPNYIDSARKLYPNKKFILSDINELRLNPPPDWVIGSGVFTYGVTMDEVLSKIGKAYELCTRGVAFNFLDKKSGLDGLLMYDSDEMVRTLSEKYDNVTHVSGYLGDEDFTVYIKKV